MANEGLDKAKSQKDKRIVFVATTPFAVNAFIANHMSALAGYFNVTLITNLHAYELSPSLRLEVQVCHVPFMRKISLWSDLKCLIMLAVELMKLKPCVVHSITPKAGLIGMLASLVARVPNRWHTFTGQVWATKKGASRTLLKVIDQFIVRAATKVFTDSASQIRFLKEQGVVGGREIGMLSVGSIAGVELSRFRPELDCQILKRDEVGTEQNACVFLFVGRLTKDKGVFDLVDAFAKLSTQELGLELWMVGPDEDGLQRALEDLAQLSRAPVRWLGATTCPESFMSAADVLVLPSYREGFGSVIIEAAACGIPTIAYRIDGVIDAVVDGETGLLVTAGETAEFLSAMKRLACEKEFRQVLGRRAYERALLDFSSEKVTQAWVTFYRNQLNEFNEASI